MKQAPLFQVIFVFMAALCLCLPSGVPAQSPVFPYYIPVGLIGQGSFESGSANKVDGFGLNMPMCVVVDNNIESIHLYVADTNNNRVLCWLTADDAFAGLPADVVYGQPNMYASSQPSETSNLTLNNPRGMFVRSDGKLLVADTNSHRILIFDPPVGSDNLPDGLLGQSGYYVHMVNYDGGMTSPYGFDNPYAVVANSDNSLFIADLYNNRVLGFQNPFGTYDSIADYCFGQSAFNMYQPNRGGANPVSNSFYFASALAFDNESKLWVADTLNNRVIRFDPPFTMLDQSAAVKLGQPSYDTRYMNWDGVNNVDNTTVAYPNGLYEPGGVAFSTAGSLYVSDSSNNRVLRWDNPISDSTPANAVFGQMDFYGMAPNRGAALPGPETLNHPNGLAIDRNGKIYIADTYNNRVLRLSSSFSPDGVCGQPDFTRAETNRLDGASIAEPVDVAFDYNYTPPRLYVLDRSNNRILGWESLDDALADNTADVVLGQPDLYSRLSGCSQTLMTYPGAVAVDKDSTVWVADSHNSRVIGFQNPWTNDNTADYLIGQDGWFTNLPNKGLPQPDEKTLSFPGAVFCPSGSSDIWIADTDNNRVLLFPNTGTFPLSATIVIGQENMSSNTANSPSINADTLAKPSDIFVDKTGNLFICDSMNNRILLYYPTFTNGMDAIRVWGQEGSFTTAHVNNGGGISEKGLNNPKNITVDPRDILFVSDVSNNRILGFRNAAAPVNDTDADFVFGQDGSFTSGGYVSGAKPTRLNLYFPLGLEFTDDNLLVAADSMFNRLLVFNLEGPPVIQRALFVDADSNGFPSSDDFLLLQFSDPLFILDGSTIVSSDFILSQGGDTLGTGFQVTVKPGNPNVLVIRLGTSPSLVISGIGSNSSTVDVTNSISTKIFSLRSGFPVIPSTPVDIKYMFKPPTPQYFGPGGGTLGILLDSDSVFTRHALYLPPGAITGTRLFSIYAPNVELPYLSAVLVNADSEAYITLQYLLEGIDTEGGFLEKYIRIALLVEVSPGVWEPQWTNASVVFDFVNGTVTIKLGNLYGAGGAAKDGLRSAWGIDGDLIIAAARNLVEQNSISASPQTGGGESGQGGASPAVLKPGSDCIYTKHELSIPSFLEASPGDYTLTIRQALAAERVGFPNQSGAIFVIESSPEFPSMVSCDITAMYVADADPSLTDVITLNGIPGPVGQMRLVRKNPSTGVFEFVSYTEVVFNDDGTVTTKGVTNLTTGGVGIYGLVVDPDASSLITAAKHWQVYE